MTLRGLLHGHTYHSPDCLLPPAAYLWYARQARLDFLCVTDHNSLAGARAVQRANRDANLEVVIGAEYRTDRGNLIGLFLHEEIRVRQWEGVIAAIHDQGGLAVLPHPMERHRLADEHWQQVDLYESFNARSLESHNVRAFEIGRALGGTEVCGADIHTFYELFNNGTLLYLEGEGSLRDRLGSAPRAMARRTMPAWGRPWGRAVHWARRTLLSPRR